MASNNEARIIHALGLVQEPGWHTVGPLQLSPGRHRLEWRPAGPAAVPDDLFGNGDRRELTVAVGAWRWLPLAVEDRRSG